MKGFVIDITTGDLLIERKQAAVVPCEEQVIENVLLANRGEFKEFPLIGAEVRMQLGGGKNVMWPGHTKKMIKACGVEVRKVSITEDNIITVE